MNLYEFLDSNADCPFTWWPASQDAELGYFSAKLGPIATMLSYKPPVCMPTLVSNGGYKKMALGSFLETYRDILSECKWLVAVNDVLPFKTSVATSWTWFTGNKVFTEGVIVNNAITADSLEDLSPVVKWWELKVTAVLLTKLTAVASYTLLSRL